MNIPSRRFLRYGVAMAAGCLLLSACGGTSTSDSDGDTGAVANMPPGTPITIGYVASESGPQANNGITGVATAKAWVKATNAAGGILGHPVVLKVTDSKNTVPGAQSAVQAYKSDSSVDLLMLTDLVAETAMKGVLADTNMAVLSGGGSSDDATWGAAPNLFQDVSGQRAVVQSMIQGAKSAGATKVGFAACAEVAVCAQNAKPAEAYASQLGLKFGGAQQISATATSYTAQCLAFRNAGVDSIAMNIGVDVGVRLIADCLQQGYTGTFAMPNSGFDQTKVGKVSGAKTVDATQGFPWWADTPAVAAFRNAMNKYSPKTPYTSGQATSVWASLELLAKALNNAKPAEINRDSVMSAMYTIQNETLGGLLAQPISYAKGQNSPTVWCLWEFKYNTGDKDPTAIPPTGPSGNGATGDLASTCVKPVS
ncbi:ABC transporter substrate-binding protein [Nocardia miyunensis]|uniref:ABC transporter substrate-binding protein n=1 Tax=Nocardia miyunensis TaxID=282684 RepID=UPI0009FFCEC8|nr:ABC transporter substrate-binding protein [Nocardia miyunensis]